MADIALTHHYTAFGLITRTGHPDGYTEWSIDGEEISVDYAADMLAQATMKGGPAAMVLQIVADHIHRDTTYGGYDWDDLIEELRRAGHTLPEPTAKEL